MGVEVLSYPYVPGEYGLPLGEFVEKFGKGPCHFGIITSASGAELEFNAYPNMITVTDVANPDRGMSAEVTNGIASFNVQTRNMGNVNGGGAPSPHPDMFASRFIRFAMDYFERNGEEVEIIKGEWVHPSDNWRTFTAGFFAHGDQIRAAKATWSGKLFASLGFPRLRKHDITLTNHGDHLLIIARFRKPFAESVNGRRNGQV